MIRSAGLHEIPQTVFTNIAIAAVSLVGSILVARILGPEGKGAVAAVIVWPELIHSVGFASINEAVTYRAASSSRDHRVVADAGLASALAVSLLPVAVCLLALPWLLGPSRSGLWEPARVYSVIFIPVTSIYLVFLALKQGRGKFREYNTLRFAKSALYVLFLACIPFIGGTSVELVLACSVAAVSALTFWEVLTRGTGSYVIGLGPLVSEVREILKQGVRFHGLTILLALSLQLERILAVQMFDNRAVGLFTVATSLTLVPAAAVGGGFSRVLFPRQASEGEGVLGVQVRKGLVWAAAGLVTLALVLGIFGGQAVPIVFGEEFRGASRLVPLLAVVAAISAWRGVAEKTLRGGQLTRMAVASEVVMILVTVSVTLVLEHKMGLEAVVWGLLCGNAAGLAVLGGWYRFDRRTIDAT